MKLIHGSREHEALFLKLAEIGQKLRSDFHCTITGSDDYFDIVLMDPDTRREVWQYIGTAEKIREAFEVWLRDQP